MDKSNDALGQKCSGQGLCSDHSLSSCNAIVMSPSILFAIVAATGLADCVCLLLVLFVFVLLLPCLVSVLFVWSLTRASLHASMHARRGDSLRHVTICIATRRHVEQ